MKPDLVLLGGGGHCRSCIDVLEELASYRIAGIVDLPEKLHRKVLGYEIFATEDDLPLLVKEYPYFLITVGQIKTAEIRQTIFRKLKVLDAKLPAIISPLAHVSRHASAGEGTIVMHHALVNAGAKVGSNCIINTKALIEHDAQVGDHCHISTGAIVNGTARIGSRTFLGSNAVCREAIAIGDNCIISAGATVKKDVPETCRTIR